jgi:hypothetical protein
MLNVTRQVGGSIGTAVLAVILQGQIKNAVGGGSATGGGLAAVPDAVRERAAAPLADAFAHTFGWSVAMCGLAIIPVIVLALTTGHGNRPGAPAGEPARDDERVAAPA